MALTLHQSDHGHSHGGLSSHGHGHSHKEKKGHSHISNHAHSNNDHTDLEHNQGMFLQYKLLFYLHIFNIFECC